MGKNANIIREVESERDRESRDKTQQMKDDGQLYSRSSHLQRARLLSQIAAQMASEYLQACLARPIGFPHHLLFAIRYLPIVIKRGPEENIRICGGILQ